MWKWAFLLHVFIWPLVMSVMMAVALAVPAMQADLTLWLAAAAVASFVLATPLSVYAARAGAKLLA